MMCENPRVVFFDGIAEQWDGWEDQEDLGRRLVAGLEELGVGPAEVVMDVGCGTGNLVIALLSRLSPAGRVLAVDISPRMIEVARRKVSDPRVTWRCEDVRALALPDGSVDRVICCSVWPHFDDPRAATTALARWLRPGGRLHVWHLLPRGKVNAIHASAGEAVRADLLVEAGETSRLLIEVGLEVTEAVDDDQRYLVSAVKPGRAEQK